MVCRAVLDLPEEQLGGMESVAIGEQFTVELNGGSPWGFSLQGGVDHRSPLRVGRVSVILLAS